MILCIISIYHIINVLTKMDDKIISKLEKKIETSKIKLKYKKYDKKSCLKEIMKLPSNKNTASNKNTNNIKKM